MVSAILAERNSRLVNCSGRSMSNPEHLPYDGVTVEAAR